MAVWGLGVINNVINWGRGAFNNLISWGIVQKTSPAGDTEIYGLRQDTDVTAFLNVTGITDATITSALDTLATDLKGYGIWDKMKAIYPFVGGTATTHKFNLKDSRDSDAAFRLAFNGGWTHSSNGALPNGTNGYADTFLTPSTSLSLNSTHISVYSRTNNARTNVDIGCEDAFGYRLYTLYNTSGNQDLSRNNNLNGSGLTTPSSLGFILNNRTTSNNMKVTLNNSIVTANSNATNQLSNAKIYIGARNTFNTNADFYSNRQLAFSTIGNGLTDTEASNLYLAVQAFQTTLNRQV
jgi:hypothetical protein